MAGRNGQELLGTYVDKALAERFRVWARETDGGASAALRRLVHQAVEGREPPPPRGVGVGHQVNVRFQPAEREALALAARARSVSPANWVRSLALVHLAREPQWNAAEVEELRALFGELRRVGSNVNQIARAANEAVLAGEHPADRADDVLQAAQLMRYEMRRVVAVMAGNFDYWGLPTDERPKPARGAVAREEAAAKAAVAKRKSRPRRRPARFRD